MSAPVRIGLTGSIGMGKSTTAAMFGDLGVPVWDADAAVHRLYSKGGAAVEAIAALRPEAIRDGAVDRAALKDWIAEDPGALAQIEAVVHPLVARDRACFTGNTVAPLILYDIPLLFETGGDAEMDHVVAVSAPAEVQRDRVLARAGMTPATFDRILAVQLSDAEKRRRADFVVETLTLAGARQQVADILVRIRKEHGLA
ncbi:dephospho-CoA kinase [Mesobaculum littorinae]|uniref:Dephospho-CoA kinase n=1 Tax=Mesobaculum littorinae TaxID=2486419 RepID=A0A438AH19_9RHOB|nr:dephospho-CoA kinase [Mesobaculum littorinae]RVV98013.1 dephospho-CoA kinase [Mesobaculum littorinae]